MNDFNDDNSVPDVILDINDLIGYEKTQALIKSLGGIDFAIPKGEQNCDSRKFLESIVGEDLAQKIMDFFGGERLYIPKCTASFKKIRNQSFINELKESMKQGFTQKFAIQQLVLKYGFTER